jgi:hypothetical protein
MGRPGPAHPHPLGRAPKNETPNYLPQRQTPEFRRQFPETETKSL